MLTEAGCEMKNKYKNQSTILFDGKFIRLLLESITTIVFALLLISNAASQSRKDFKLENITVKAGEKGTGFVEVPNGVDEGTQIPVSIFHGIGEGKVFVIMSGLHGSEYAPILGVQRLAKQLNPKKLNGTIILIHIANLPSFLKRTVYYGMDGKNLNRVFPGKSDGTITERIAHILIEKIIKRGDFLIDVHSGDNNESLRPYVVYYDAPTVERAKVEVSRQMAFAFGIDFIKRTQIPELDYNKSNYGTRAALASGLAVMAVESGQLGKPEEIAIDRVEKGLLSVLRAMKFIEGKPIQTKNPTILKRDHTVRAKQTGLFYSLVNLSQKVKKDQLLGYVTDYFGNKIEEAKAPFEGVVMYFTATPPVSVGEPLVNIGEFDR